MPLWIKLPVTHTHTNLATSTAYLTFDAIHRYLKKRWCADQNWPHIVFFIRLSASINSAASWNLVIASTHWKNKDWLRRLNGALLEQITVETLPLSSYQLHRVVVHFNELLVERNFFDFESHTVETQLSGNICTSQFHIHGDDLHSSDTPEMKNSKSTIRHLEHSRSLMSNHKKCNSTVSDQRLHDGIRTV